MDGDSRDFLYKYALQNAVMHNNVPKAGAVLGALMGKHPELRPHAREYSALLAEILAEIGAMDPDARHARLEEIEPEFLEKKEKKKREEEEARKKEEEEADKKKKAKADLNADAGKHPVPSPDLESGTLAEKLAAGFSAAYEERAGN